MLMKGLFGASWRAHNRGGVEIFLAMNRRYEGTFFSPLHLWNRTVKILYYVDFWAPLIHEWKDIGHCLVHYFGNRICGNPVCCISMDFQPWFFELGADVDWWWFDHRLLNHVRVRFLYEYQDALNQYCSRVNFLPYFTMKTSLGTVFFGRAAKITWVSNSCHRLREPTPRYKK